MSFKCFLYPLQKKGEKLDRHKLGCPRPIPHMLDIPLSFEKSNSVLWATVQNKFQIQISQYLKYETGARVGSSDGNWRRLDIPTVNRPIELIKFN
jgi:hypothetical protein